MKEIRKNGTATESDGTGRLRSPAYPAINLESAIERAGIFYDLEKRNSANRAVAIKHWGYDSNSSLGARVVAALKQFGLMKEVGDQVQLTELALRILLDKRPDSRERLKAIQEAALCPKIHVALLKQWPESLPTDDNLRHDLIFKWRFNENFVDKFISQFRATLVFSKLGSGDRMSAGVADTPDVGDAFDAASIESEDLATERERGGRIAYGVLSTAKPNLAPKSGMNQDVFTLEEGDVTIQWPKALSEASYQDLEDWLELIKRKAKRAIKRPTDPDDVE